LNWYANSADLKHPTDWYQVKYSQIAELGGAPLQQLYPTMYELISAVYPERNWHAWLFEQVPRGFWNSAANRKRYLEWLAEVLTFEKAEHWYAMQTSIIRHTSGYSLLQRYEGSLYKLLADVYPQYSWLGWRFEKIPNKYWDNAEHEKSYMEWFSNHFDLKQPEDWISITEENFAETNGLSLINKYGKHCGLEHLIHFLIHLSRYTSQIIGSPLSRHTLGYSGCKCPRRNGCKTQETIVSNDAFDASKHSH
jgi:hypothetical protein